MRKALFALLFMLLAVPAFGATAKFDRTFTFKEGGSNRVIVANGASVRAYVRGGECSADQTASNIAVYASGNFTASDTVEVNGTAATVQTVPDATHITLDVSVTCEDGDAVLQTTTPPTLYFDSTSTVTITPPVTASTIGRAQFYVEEGNYDLKVIAASGEFTTAYFSDVTINVSVGGDAVLKDGSVTMTGALDVGSVGLTSSTETSIQFNGEGITEVPFFNTRYYVDGVTYTLDKTGIEAAMTAACAQGGGIVELPEGTITLDDPNTPTNCGLTLCSNIHLVGQGMGKTTLELEDNCQDSVVQLSVNPAAHIAVTDMTLDGQAASQVSEGAGVNIGNGTDIYLARLEVTDTRGHGIYVHPTNHDMARVRIKDNYVHHTGLYSGAGEGSALRVDSHASYTVGQVIITGNTLYRNAHENTSAGKAATTSQAGIHVYGITGTYNLNQAIITENHVSEQWGTGIHVSSINKVTVDDNTVVDSAQADDDVGIGTCSSSCGNGIHMAYIQEGVVDGNVVKGVGASAKADNGIELSGTPGGNVIFSNNRVEETGRNCISTDAQNRVLISGNNLGACGSAGIVAQGTAASLIYGIVIADNMIYNTGTVTTGDGYGIILGAKYGGTITGNFILLTTAHGIWAELDVGDGYHNAHLGVSNNTLKTIAGDAISILATGGGGGNGSDFVVSGNVINTTTGASSNGIRMEGGVNGVIANNAIQTVGDDHIYILDWNNLVITGNLLDFAVDNGIELDGTSEDILIDSNFFARISGWGIEEGATASLTKLVIGQGNHFGGMTNDQAVQSRLGFLIVDGDATPSVKGVQNISLESTQTGAGTFDITDFDDGYQGQILYISCNEDNGTDLNTEIQHNANIKMDPAYFTDFLCVDGKERTLTLQKAGALWVALSRSDNDT